MTVVTKHFFCTPERCLIFRSWNRPVGGFFVWKVSCRSLAETISEVMGTLNANWWCRLHFEMTVAWTGYLVQYHHLMHEEVNHLAYMFYALKNSKCERPQVVQLWYKWSATVIVHCVELQWFLPARNEFPRKHMTYLVHFTFANRKKLRAFISNSKFCIEWGSLCRSRCTYLHGSELISSDQLRMGSANSTSTCHFLLRNVEGPEIICANTEKG